MEYLNKFNDNNKDLENVSKALPIDDDFTIVQKGKEEPIIVFSESLMEKLQTSKNDGDYIKYTDAEALTYLRDVENETFINYNPWLYREFNQAKADRFVNSIISAALKSSTERNMFSEIEKVKNKLVLS